VEDIDEAHARKFSGRAFTGCTVAAPAVGNADWSSPKGGTGITISGDLAMPNSDLNKGPLRCTRLIGLANILSPRHRVVKPIGRARQLYVRRRQAAFRVSAEAHSLSISSAGGRVARRGGRTVIRRRRDWASWWRSVVQRCRPRDWSIEPYLALNIAGTNSPASAARIQHWVWTLVPRWIRMLGLHLALRLRDLGRWGEGWESSACAHVALKAPSGCKRH